MLAPSSRADRPIVQAIDNVARDHKLRLLFETRVGSGRLLQVCNPARASVSQSGTR